MPKPPANNRLPTQRQPHDTLPNPPPHSPLPNSPPIPVQTIEPPSAESRRSNDRDPNPANPIIPITLILTITNHAKPSLKIRPSARQNPCNHPQNLTNPRPFTPTTRPRPRTNDRKCAEITGKPKNPVHPVYRCKTPPYEETGRIAYDFDHWIPAQARTPSGRVLECP